MYSQLNEKGEINIVQIYSVMKLARKLNTRAEEAGKRTVLGGFIYFI